MFTSNKVSKSMLDAVSKVLAEEEVQPKKKLILEPEKEKAKVAEEDEKKPGSPFDWKNTPRTTMKPGERTGHEHKKTSTGNVFMKKYKKEKMEEEADCVTEPKAKEIAKKEVKGHEKAMHKEEFSIESFMAEEFTEEQLDGMINEVLAKSAKAGEWIHDFVHSDNPKFKGKSKEKRKQMALAAYYSKQRNEEVEMVNEELKTKTAYVPYVYTDRHGSGFGGYDVHYAKEADAHAHIARHGHLDVNGKKGWVEKHEIAKHPSGRWVDANHMRRHGESMHEDVQHLEELSDLADTSNEEALAPDQKTTDTLRGREKGGKHNQHNTFKVKLKAEETVDEMKRPLDGDTFVTNEESPLKLAKHIAKKSFHKIRQETMMGKAGATSEEKENE